MSGPRRRLDDLLLLVTLLHKLTMLVIHQSQQLWKKVLMRPLIWKIKILEKDSYFLSSMDLKLKLNLHGFPGFIYGGEGSSPVGSDLARYWFPQDWRIPSHGLPHYWLPSHGLPLPLNWHGSTVVFQETVHLIVGTKTKNK